MMISLAPTGIKGVSLVGRGVEEPTCSQRSTGAPRRRGLGRSRAPGLCELDWVARGELVVVQRLLEGC